MYKFLNLVFDLLIGIRSLAYLFCFSFTVLLASFSYAILLIFLPTRFLWRFFIGPVTWLCLRVAGQKLKIEGEIPPIENGPYLFLSNHESFFDGFMFGRALPYYITAIGAKSYFYLPIWGWMMKMHGVIPIDRRDHQSALDSLDLAKTVLKDGDSILMFPEGTRRSGKSLEIFKKGAFHLAIKTQVTIVPCAIVGAWNAWPKGSWRIMPGTITLRFGRPIPVAEYREEYLEYGVEGILLLVRSRIINELFDATFEEDVKS